MWEILQKDTVDKPGGDILYAYCTCTAGLQGSCDHIVGMLFHIESAVATGATRPSKTSVDCQCLRQTRRTGKGWKLLKIILTKHEIYGINPGRFSKF